MGIGRQGGGNREGGGGYFTDEYDGMPGLT